MLGEMRFILKLVYRESIDLRISKDCIMEVVWIL